MIGENQNMVYYTYETGVNISSIKKIYDFVEERDITYLCFLTENFKMIPCKLKYKGKFDTVKIKTENNVEHYLAEEGIISEGIKKNVEDFKLGELIAKQIRRSFHFKKQDEIKSLANKNDISETYHMGMFLGLIYGFGGISKHKIVFTLQEENLYGIKGKFITLEETIVKLISMIGITSYRVIKEFDKKGNILHRYEIMMNLKTSKIINEIFDKYINSFQKKLNFIKFIENPMFSNGFIDAFLNKSFTTEYRTNDTLAVRELYILSTIFGIYCNLTKEKSMYTLKFENTYEKDFIFGLSHEKIKEIEILKNKDCYDIIPINKEDNNIFVTASKCFLDRRNIS